MEKRTISISKIKSVGPLKKILDKFEMRITETEKNGYSKEVARLLKLIVQFGLVDDDTWQEQIQKEQDPAKKEHLSSQIDPMLWLSHLFVIRLNNIAQKHLNNIDMEPNHVQLGKSSSMKKYYPNVTFVA